ncbi:MAG: hypothetical protein Q8P56_01310, partial [Candidatus Uhrbacteria bacterium]|nr:hypothetical protein [Candidatus Uhrbacteria bacterium]
NSLNNIWNCENSIVSSSGTKSRLIADEKLKTSQKSKSNLKNNWIKVAILRPPNTRMTINSMKERKMRKAKKDSQPSRNWSKKYKTKKITFNFMSDFIRDFV